MFEDVFENRDCSEWGRVAVALKCHQIVSIFLLSASGTIGVDLYTFVCARAPTMLSWAPPPRCSGHPQPKLVLASLFRFCDARAGAVTRTQGRGQSVTTTVLASSLNLDAFTLEAGWEHGKEVDGITLHTSLTAKQ